MSVERKWSAALLAVLLLSSPSWAQRRVAVATFREIGGAAEEKRLGKALADRIARLLEDSPFFQPLSRSRVDALLPQPPDIVDPATAVELGQRLGADVVVDGNVFVLRPGWVMANARFIDTITGEISLTPAFQAKEPRAVQEIARSIVSELNARVPLTAPITALISEQGRTEVGIGAGTRQGVSEGARFEIFRAGEALVNPATGETFGRALKRVALVEIRVAEEEQSWGVVVAKSEEFGIRDLARLLAPAQAQRPPLSLIVTSKPAGALVYVDAQLRGATPLAVFGLQPGKHKVRLHRDGYKDFEQEVETAEGEVRLAFAQLVLLPPQGNLVISSEPAGALVLLDGEQVGVTPLELKNIPAGRHTVTLRKEGFKVYQTTVEVEAHRLAEINAKLEPEVATVHIQTKPPKAEVFFDGKFVGQSPLTLQNVRVGEHEVMVRLKGYRPQKRKVVIAPGEQRVGFIMEVLTGKLRVRSDPPGARVMMGGEEKGKTPLFLPEVPIGTYRLLVALPGYKPYVADVVIKADEETVVDAILERERGSLRVETEPPGALIVVDGKARGKSPLSLKDVGAGEHVVVAQLEGYERVERRVVVEAEKEAVLRIRLVRVMGAIEVDSVPQGAKVYVDDAYVGDTPLKPTEVVPGKHKIRLELEGYRPYETEAVVEPKRSTRLFAKLERKAGALEVVSVPEGASVFIDGKYAGVTPFKVDELAAGEHEVRVVMRGYIPFVRKVTIEDRRTTKVETLLRPEERGTLVVLSEPTGAQVSVDGLVQGLTPLAISHLAVGKHKVVVTKKGYEKWEGETEIKPGATSQLFIRLKPLYPTPPPRPPNIIASFPVEGPEGKGTARLSVYVEPAFLIVDLEMPWPVKIQPLMIPAPRHLALSLPGIRVKEPARKVTVNRTGVTDILIRPLSDKLQILIYLTPAAQVQFIPMEKPGLTRIIVTKKTKAKAPPRPLKVFTGIASWYGWRFHGRRTASGIRFDCRKMVAAHPTLPLGTKVRVINLHTGKSAILTIVDRGPFVRGRIIDVSRGAAARLGFLRRGLARVRVEVLSLPKKRTKRKKGKR